MSEGLLISLLIWGGLLAGLMLFTGIMINIHKPAKREERLRKFPAKINKALDEARRATKSCLAMHNALFLEELLSSQAGLEERLKQLQNGPTNAQLIKKSRARAVKAIKQCGKLSVEGLKDSWEGEHAGLRTYFSLAEVACKDCQHDTESTECPAAVFLEKINLM